MRTRTILVVYTRVYLHTIPIGIKQYAFNTESELSIGDMITNRAYTTPMQVVKVYDMECFQYYNTVSELLTYSKFNNEQFLIKEMQFNKLKQLA